MLCVATIVGIIAGVWFGVRTGFGFPVILLWAMGGGMATIMTAALSDPQSMNAFDSFRQDSDFTPASFSRALAVVFFVAAAVFILFTPLSLRGPYLGYANPAIPSALAWGGMLSIIRLMNANAKLTILGVLFWISTAGAFWILPLQRP